MGDASVTDHTLFVDSFDVDVMSETYEVCESQDNVSATLNAWEPKNGTAAYPTGISVREAVALHAGRRRVPNPRVRSGPRASFDMVIMNKDFSATLPFDEFQRRHHMRFSMVCTAWNRRLFRTRKGLMGDRSRDDGGWGWDLRHSWWADVVYTPRVVRWRTRRYIWIREPIRR
ncbi:hypothetical protein P152DRAFT_461081 [Eremomyces bilateralis CBS 781.70]|uniref:Uncharacterized protein n=1 Tax=Eremomyces bilateralis CBS 781.70 TaxID=1392243 RepID=A0A6G1FW52_9PEZI|nr:uncharacterized protein P152DRAFT_461081 [Eremomyces bilateralis CBS 781.70]KAF1810003.1 hypothetical protein P152DRAFT_461081 [Eremomyces bilateralis CBS 781.70]